MSQVSMCEAPPLSQIMIADLAILRVGEDTTAGAESAVPLAKLAPSRLSPPATRKVRLSRGEAGRKRRDIASDVNSGSRMRQSNSRDSRPHHGVGVALPR